MAQLTDEEVLKAKELMTAITPEGIKRMAKWMAIEDVEKQIERLGVEHASAYSEITASITALEEQRQNLRNQWLTATASLREQIEQIEKA